MYLTTTPFPQPTPPAQPLPSPLHLRHLNSNPSAPQPPSPQLPQLPSYPVHAPLTPTPLSAPHQYSPNHPQPHISSSSKENQTIHQEDLCKLEQWEDKWHKQFNADVCEVIRITNKRNPIIGNYHIHGQQLIIVKKIKYLGNTISPDLSWNRHIANTMKKATTAWDKTSGRALQWSRNSVTSHLYDRLFSMLTVFGIPLQAISLRWCNDVRLLRKWRKVKR